MMRRFSTARELEHADDAEGAQHRHGEEGGMAREDAANVQPTSPMETMTTTRSKVLKESILKIFQPRPASLTALSR